MTEAVTQPELLDMDPPSCVHDTDTNLSGSMCSPPLIPSLAAKLLPTPRPFSSISKACVSNESKCEAHGRRMISSTPSSRNSAGALSWHLMKESSSSLSSLRGWGFPGHPHPENVNEILPTSTEPARDPAGPNPKSLQGSM